MKKIGLYLAILLLASCSDEVSPGHSPTITEEMRMTYADFATRFATALADEDYGAAYQMLSPEMQRKYTQDGLGKSFEEMVEYGGSQAKVDGFVHSMEDWPDKKSADIGWAYVSVSGDDYAEAVTVIVSAVDDGMAISSIEWGRP